MPGFRALAGHSLLVLGVAGVLLPVIPGTPLLIAGYALLDPKQKSILAGLGWKRVKARSASDELRAILPAATYIHHIAGRLRARVPELKGWPTRGSAIAQELCNGTGVQSATANPTTGSILVHYDPARTDAASIAASISNELLRLS
ncbi:MAG: hypothetical protein JO307_07580 [Bryobacterales bacterium]|nr:hypothetical protein [Bryobacterales bacterium]